MKHFENLNRNIRYIIIQIFTVQINAVPSVNPEALPGSSSSESNATAGVNFVPYSQFAISEVSERSPNAHDVTAASTSFRKKLIRETNQFSLLGLLVYYAILRRNLRS